MSGFGYLLMFGYNQRKGYRLATTFLGSIYPLPKICKKTTPLGPGKVRGSLTKLTDEDGAYLERILIEQRESQKSYPLTAIDRKNLRPSMINSETGQIVVSIPEDDGMASGRRRMETEHTKVQALIAKIGESMGFRIWLPFVDRQRVLEEWNPAGDNTILNRLPLNYDNVTLRTIENIDVLWIRRNAIVRAFEIEHSTSIYSGLLRMADLMSLQPNLKDQSPYCCAHIPAKEGAAGNIPAGFRADGEWADVRIMLLFVL